MIGLPSAPARARGLRPGDRRRRGRRRPGDRRGEARPATARYWVCTVEAMPIERERRLRRRRRDPARRPPRARPRLHRSPAPRAGPRRDLVPRRGHHAADDPGARAHCRGASAHPRLSRFSFAGAAAIGQLPPRSAVVAFSTEQVYELAERLSDGVGGVAVVLGALSPRARNAQVAMYQSGEVDHLVATDAIGMGLNLDLDHVAFAGLSQVRRREAADLSRLSSRRSRAAPGATERRELRHARARWAAPGAAVACGRAPQLRARASLGLALEASFASTASMP